MMCLFSLLLEVNYNFIVTTTTTTRTTRSILVIQKEVSTMVVKKFLCAAPRPDTWKEKADKLLQSLGGDVEKRDLLVRQTITALREQQ
jgi:hypothetical protein